MEQAAADDSDKQASIPAFERLCEYTFDQTQAAVGCVSHRCFSSDIGHVLFVLPAEQAAENIAKIAEIQTTRAADEVIHLRRDGRR